jgi:hypothetical protein
MTILVLVMMLCSISTSVLSQNIRAKTEDGKEVILLSDGTWEHVTPEEPLPSLSHSNPQGSKRLLKGKRGTYGIWIDEDKWRMSNVTFDPAAEFGFAHTAGNVYAMVIDANLYMPFEQLKNVALENIQKEAPDAKITFEEKRSIKANELFYMTIEGTVQAIPSVFFGYYYSGEAGTIQIITYAAKDLIDDFESDFIEFFNGFEVYTPSHREISFADGSTYSGSIVNGKMHGSGTYTWLNGDQYVGEFTENRASGGWLNKSGGRTVWCYQEEHGIWIIEER